MIQARIPESVLRELTVGASTAAIIPRIRRGETDALPASLVAWVRRNGFDSGEEVQLLPETVPAPPPTFADLALRERRVRRWAFRFGMLAHTLALVLPLLTAAAFYQFAPPNDASLGVAIGAAGVLWLLLQVAPIFLLPALTSMQAGTFDRQLFATPPDVLGTLFLVGAAYAVNLIGWALLARARGASPWLAFLGILSLCFRGHRLLSSSSPPYPSRHDRKPL